ncbi:MAG: glycerol-3-phosphate dehydrogenase [Bacteroidetes bacterium GWE2_29_8]|nr:MAG: glycerol-3-phosphate dehydrogenase [Bacteroidetes bacterium GWE2_29_8]
MINKRNIAVLGDGSWATAIVKMLLNNNDNVNWWVREEDDANYIRTFNHNKNYLSSVEFDVNKLNISSDINEIVLQSDVIFLVIPALYINDSLKPLKKEAFMGKKVVSAVKGIIPESNLIVADYLYQNFDFPYDSFGVIGGPCHSEEVALEKLSYLTFAFKDIDNANIIANMFKCRYIYTSISDDIIGIEYAAVLKNIYAVASGICVALGFGDNFQAVLMTNAILEMEQFLNASHPLTRDIKSTVYLGDLLVTGYSQFSRNRAFGNMIGKGYSVKVTKLEMKMIAEGYYATKGIIEINKNYNVQMPICEATYNILYLNRSPRKEINLLAEKLL